MKKYKFLLYSAFALVVFAGMSHIVRSSGSPGGLTGSPGDGAATCTSCHGGGKATEKTGWITTDIPEAGYRPEEEYMITVKGEHSTAKEFGFELTAEQTGNVKTGGFDRSGNSQIQLLSAGKAVTHTSQGTTPSGQQKSWSVKWKAPSAGKGVVTFYAAVNAANGDGGTGGDAIFSTKLAIPEQDLSSDELSANTKWIRIYPNPASNLVNLEFAGLQGNDFNVSLYSVSGQRVLNKTFRPEPGSRSIPLSVSGLPDGTYFAVINSENQFVKSKLIVTR